MAFELPEPDSFGTVVRFAEAAERIAAEITTAASKRLEGHPSASAAQATAKAHAKRLERMERLRRESLNELVLAPVPGLSRDDYAFPPEIRADEPPAAVLALVAELEGTLARFYEDAARAGENVLGAVARTFRKLAEENRALAQKLRA